MSDDSFLTEKQKLARENMMLKLQKEIKELEHKKEIRKGLNKSINIKRNFLIALKISLHSLPYILSTSIILLFCNFISGFPKGNKKVYLNIMTELDSQGNVRYERQYGSFESDNFMCSYSKWFLEDGLYSRIIKTYNIESKTKEELMALLEKDDLSLEDVFGKPISNIKESKENLTEEEINEEAFIKLAIYEEDKNDYIIQKLSTEDIITGSALFIMLVTLVNLLICILRNDFCNYKELIEKIKEKYPDENPEALEELQLKLKIKKDNYERLTR